MNLLLDTHVALWAIADSPRLSAKAREPILSPRATIWISAATIWEIAIKHGLARGNMPVSGEEAIRHFRSAGFQFLSVEPEHAAAVDALPGHHQDPFDRLLVAQAIVEPMRLITHDTAVARYSDTILGGLIEKSYPLVTAVLFAFPICFTTKDTKDTKRLDNEALDPVL